MGGSVWARASGRAYQLGEALARQREEVSRDLALFFLVIFLIGIGFGINRAAYSNLLEGDFGIGGGQLGILESVREIPGLLTVAVAAGTASLGLPHLGAASLAILGLGYAGYSMSGNLSVLVFFVIVASFGFHSWMPLRPVMAMALAKPGQEGHRLGQTVSVGALASIAGMGLVIVISRWVSLRQMYLVAGGATLLGACAVIAISTRGWQTQRPRFVARRRYGLYYVLSFIMGCRKQIASVFAIFTLVQVYGATVQTVATLLIVSNILSLLLAARVGRLVDEWGERRALTFGFGCLGLAFLGYAITRQFYVLCGLYLIMMLVTNLPAIGVTTYLRKMAPAEDVHPSLCLGQSIDHFASVIMPLVEGALYALVSYQAAFLAAAGVAFLGMVISRGVKVGAATSGG